GRAVLSPEDHGLARAVAAQEVLSEVEARVREEPGPRHAIIDKDALALLPVHTAKVPQGGPEGLAFRDGEGMDVSIVGKAPPDTLTEEVHEPPQGRFRHTFRRRGP